MVYDTPIHRNIDMNSRTSSIQQRCPLSSLTSDGAAAAACREGWAPFGLGGCQILSPLAVLQQATASGQLSVDLGLSAASDSQRNRLGDGEESQKRYWPSGCLV